MAKPYTTKNLDDRALAIQSLFKNLSYIEAFEVSARSTALLSDEAFNIGPLPARYVAEDSGHLKTFAESFPENQGWVSEDLLYSLRTVMRSGRPAMAELAHLLVVEPAVQAIAETLASKPVPHQSLLKKLAEDEAGHLKLAEALAPSARKYDREFAEFVEENGLLLYSTVFPSEEGKTMLLTAMGEDEDNRQQLMKIYTQADRLRAENTEKMFGSFSEALKAVKNYGLAKTGLC
ncbi:MAG: hypothetical protein QXQ70_03665 [Candidatus Caldarchaeum sp.]